MNLSQFSLEGKVALVTGGSRGIGYASAMAMADAGANVVVSSRKIADLEPVAEQIRAKGVKSLAVAAHNAKLDDSKTLIEKVMQTIRASRHSRQQRRNQSILWHPYGPG